MALGLLKYNGTEDEGQLAAAESWGAVFPHRQFSVQLVEETIDGPCLQHTITVSPGAPLSSLLRFTRRESAGSYCFVLGNRKLSVETPFAAQGVEEGDCIYACLAVTRIVLKFACCGRLKHHAVDFSNPDATVSSMKVKGRLMFNGGWLRPWERLAVHQLCRDSVLLVFEE